MGDPGEGRLIRIEHFQIDIREPYMGNTVPIRIEVRTFYRGGYYSRLKVTNPEGIWSWASPAPDVQSLNEGDR